MSQTPATVRALVIDDDQEDANFIKDLLADAKRSRFLVDAVTDRDAALERLKHHKYDVLLMDYKLSSNGDTTTGLDLMDRIRDAHYNTPVILITSHGDRHVQMEAVERGCADYLEKGTYNADTLERACLYAIGLTQRQRETATGGESMAGMFSRLLELTRESVAGQTQTANEVKGLRKDISNTLQSELKNLEGRCDTRCADVKTEMGEVTKGLTDVQTDIRKTQKFRWVLDWIVENKLPAAVIFLAGLLIAVLATLLLLVLDTDKINDLRGGPDVETTGEVLP